MLDSMNLKILLPYEIFLEQEQVSRMVLDTYQGYYGIWPNRLDFSAAIAPGILTYQVKDRPETYLALDEGIAVKTGAQVTISVRNAISGNELGKLKREIEKMMNEIEDQEVEVRKVIAKLETGFIRKLKSVRNA